MCSKTRVKLYLCRVLTIKEGVLMDKKFPAKYVYLVLFTTLVSQLYLEWHYTLAWGDGFVQFEMAYQWYLGEGLQLCETYTNDLSQNLCSNKLLWPPGYPLLLKVFFPTFKDFIITGRFLDCVGLGLLIILHFKILQLVGFPRKVIFFIFLFLTFSLTPFTFLYSTDLWSMLAYECSIWYALVVLKKQSQGWLTTVLLALCIFSMVFFKYMYYNLCIIPSSFLVIGFIKSDRKLKIQAFGLIGLLSVFTFLYFWWMANYTGRLVPLSRLETGIFFQHLLQINPFAFKSLFYTGTIYEYLIIHKMDNHWIKTALLIGELMVSFIMIWIICYFVFWKKKILTQLSDDYLKKSYFILIIFTVIFNTAYLGTLSVVYRWANGWTYVQDTRYYIPSLLGILTLFFYLSQNSALPKLYRFVSRILLIASFSFSFAYATYRVVAISFLNHANYNIYNLFDEIWEVNAQVPKLVTEIKTPQKPVVFSAADSRTSQYAYFSGSSQIELEKILEDGVHTSRPITLLLYVPAKDYQKEYATILKNRTHRVLKKIEKRRMVYLQVDVEPTSK